MSGGPFRARLNYRVKRALAHTLYALGVLQLWQRVALRNRAVVLMYHRVLTPDERRAAGSHPAMIVSRAAFDMQMGVLARRFVPLSVEAFGERLWQRTPFESSSCLITFDDGWRDNLTNAVPALVAHQLPALIFLPVNFIGTSRVFWQEALRHLLGRAIALHLDEPARREEIEALFGPMGLTPLLQPVEVGVSSPVLFRAIDGLKTRPRAAIMAFVEALSTALGLPLADLSKTDGFMTWDDVVALAQHGVHFGGHGVEHHLLTLVPPEVVEAEAAGSRTVVGQRFGEPPMAFSYPNGYVDDAVIATVKAVGYRLGFITRRGAVSCSDDPMTIRRLNIHDEMTDTEPLFLARLVGLW